MLAHRPRRGGRKGGGGGTCADLGGLRDGLALAIAVAALLAAPIGIASGGMRLLRPTILLAGAGVAMLSSVIILAIGCVIAASVGTIYAKAAPSAGKRAAGS